MTINNSSSEEAIARTTIGGSVTLRLNAAVAIGIVFLLRVLRKALATLTAARVVPLTPALEDESCSYL
ncbi:conserved hypothetical protein [Ricinus communis]|uniref:Uncharacterized protein n=1 Tax=Ricinus communis TaxID=3988 RepID=B9SVP2_RICCO|nr:conserved hypothetical protein [Ricinus communis]